MPTIDDKKEKPKRDQSKESKQKSSKGPSKTVSGKSSKKGLEKRPAWDSSYNIVVLQQSRSRDKFLPLLYDKSARKKALELAPPKPEPPKPEPPKPEPPKQEPPKQEPPKQEPPKPKQEEPKKVDVPPKSHDNHVHDFTERKDRKTQYERLPVGDYNDMVTRLTEQIDEMIGNTTPTDENMFPNLDEELECLKLNYFSIPLQDKLIHMLYSDGNETRPCHFGGNMWVYYSNILRCFVPINMQGRYRGAGLFTKSLSAIDVSRLGLKFEETRKTAEMKDERNAKEMNAFASVALDEEHYLFLRQLWHLHPSSLPLTHTYEILCATVPILQDVTITYTRRIGKTHVVSLEARKRYSALKDKLDSYVKLLLEPVELLLPRDPRYNMNEEELLDAITPEFEATEEQYQKLKEGGYELLSVPQYTFHDLIDETLEYRQKLEIDQFVKTDK